MNIKYALFCSTVAILTASSSKAAMAENIKLSAMAPIVTLAGGIAPSRAKKPAVQSANPAPPSSPSDKAALPPVSPPQVPPRVPITTWPSALSPRPAPPPPVIGPIPEAKAALVITGKKAIKKSQRARESNVDDCFWQSNRHAKRNAPIGSEERLRACDNELAIANGSTDSRFRRSWLLSRRSLHAYNLGAYQDALIAADTADSLAKDANDIVYNGSVAIANGMVRAASLSQLGKKQEALAEIDRLRSVRPHAGSITNALDRIASSIDLDIDRRLERMVNSIKWQPDNARGLAPLYVWRGKFEQAIQIADQVSFQEPAQLSQFYATSNRGPDTRFKNAELQMNLAYSLAALGKPEQAAQKISDARRDIRDYLGTDPSLENPPILDPSAIRVYNFKKAEIANVIKLVDVWEMGIALRPKLASMTTQEATAALDPLVSMGLARSELSRNISLKEGAGGQQPAFDFARFDEIFVQQALRLSPGELDKLIPTLEQIIYIPQFGKFGSPSWWAGVTGFSQGKEPAAAHEYRNITYGAQSGVSPAMTEELALLATAAFARIDGYDSFIILAHQFVKRQTRSGGYNGQIYDSGYETRLRVVMLNSDRLAPEWTKKRHRLVTLAEINQNLVPRYDQIFALRTNAQ